MARAVDQRVMSARLGVLVVCVLGFASGCRWHGIVDNFGREPAIPEDFSFAMTTTGAADSPLALDFHADRNGRAAWRTWNWATGVEMDHGETEITEEQIGWLWFASVDAKFDTGSPPADYVGKNATGVERIALRANGAERTVWRPSGAADVAGIRRAVFAIIPPAVAAPLTSR